VGHRCKENLTAQALPFNGGLHVASLANGVTDALFVGRRYRSSPCSPSALPVRALAGWFVALVPSSGNVEFCSLGPLPGSWASGRLEPFPAFTRLISAISSLHGTPAAHSPPAPLHSLSRHTPEVQFQPAVCVWRGYGGDAEGLGWAPELRSQPFGGKRAHQRPPGRWLNRWGRPA
jgi:hypothetical protein